MYCALVQVIWIIAHYKGNARRYNTYIYSTRSLIHRLLSLTPASYAIRTYNAYTYGVTRYENGSPGATHSVCPYIPTSHHIASQ